MDATKLIEKAGGVEMVAAEFEMTTQAIYRWQRNGYVPINKLRKLAKMAGVPLTKLGGLIP